jgi:hypothetical protein
MSIFQDTADQYPITKIVCADAWLAYTVYRNIVINSTSNVDDILLARTDH